MITEHKCRCYMETIRENILYYMMKNNGKKPSVIFMSEPLYKLLGGVSSNKKKSKFADIKVRVFADDSFDYWFAGNEQKGSDP